MRIYINKSFAKFCRKEGITDAALLKAVEDVDAGKIDADYGGGVIKQRIARPNEGKSGGYRVIVYYRSGERTFFVYGFAKKDQANISSDEVLFLKKHAKELLALSESDLTKLIKNETYQEVIGNG